MSDRRLRRGMTLIDLMALILVAGVLSVALIPAQATSRRAATRMRCAANLRQVGLGLMGFVTTKGYYPNAGTFREREGIADVRESVINGLFPEGKPSGDLARANPLRSWVVDILPYIDEMDAADAWRNDLPFDDDTSTPERPSNRTLGSKSLPILTCPEADRPATPGDLAYVVNAGFTRWHAVPYTWEPSPAGPKNGPPLSWVGPPLREGTAQQAVTTKTGVMFLGTHTGKYPWDWRTSMSSIVDGSSTTILASESLHAGASKGSPYAGGSSTTWACPHPNFVTLVGSDRIAAPGRPYDCADGTLAATADGKDGPAWAEANRPGAFGSINDPEAKPDRGSSLAPGSSHRGGVNVLFCDGAVRFVEEAIDGHVWAKLLTPAGSKLPAYARQLRLSAADF